MSRAADRPGTAAGLPWRYVGIAVACHAVLLILSPGRIRVFPASPRPLTLELRTALPAKEPVEAAKAGGETAVRNTPARPLAPPAGAPAAGDPEPPAPAAVPTAPAGAELAAAARSFLREESRRRSGDPMAPPPSPRRPGTSPLERATAPVIAGEQMLREGVIKITTPDGSSYCLQRPPAVANRDGAVAVISIPLSCPILF